MVCKVTGLLIGMTAGILTAWLGGVPVRAEEVSCAEPNTTVQNNLPDWHTRAAMAVLEADPDSPVFTESAANCYGDAVSRKGIDEENKNAFTKEQTNSTAAAASPSSAGSTSAGYSSMQESSASKAPQSTAAGSGSSSPSSTTASDSTVKPSVSETEEAVPVEGTENETAEKIYGKDAPCEPMAKSNTNTCRVLAMADISGDYQHNLHTLLHNTETGSYYLIHQYINENFTGYTYLPAGNYAVDETSADDGNEDLIFSVSGDTEFTLEDGASHTIQITAREATESQAKSTAEASTSLDDSEFAAQGVSTESPAEENNTDDAVLPWRKVSQDGRGPSIQYDGLSTGSYDIVLRITHSGPIGEAKYLLYCNGMAQNEQILTDTIRLVIPEGGSHGEDLDTGLSITCPEGEYEINTAYSFSTLREWAVSSDATGTGIVYMAGVPEKKETIGCQLRIVESGALGEATYVLSGDGGESWGKETVVPGDGIIEAEDLLIRLAPGDYAADDLYYAEIEGVPKKDYSNTVLLVIILLAAGIFATVFIVLTKRRNGAERFALDSFGATDAENLSEMNEEDTEETDGRVDTGDPDEETSSL